MATKKKPAKKADAGPIKSQIRLPAELHARLVEAAQKTRRSFNAEMLVRLEESFK